MKKILKKTFGGLLVTSPFLFISTLLAIDKGIMVVFAMVASIVITIGVIFLGIHLIITADD